MNNEVLHKKQIFRIIKDKNLTNSKNISIDVKSMGRNMLNKLNQFEELLKLKGQQINQSNPKNILKKGYAIIRDERYKIIKDSKNAKKRAALKIEMADGYIDVFRKKKKT